jgi:ketosteroid isomerase-like protein
MDTAADEVLAAARERADALVRGDVERLRRVLHPDLRWTTHRGEVLDRERYVAGNTAGPLAWLGQRLHDVELAVVGATAVLVAVVEDDVERDGVRQTFRLRLTLTWVRDERGWTCLAGHAGPPVA